MDATITILNRVIETPALLRPVESVLVAPDLEITRMQNEINRELDKAQIDEETVKKLLFSCTAAKYAAIPDAVPALQTHFIGIHPMEKLDAELFSQTVERLLITKNGTITLQMIDGTMLPHYECDTQTRSA